MISKERLGAAKDVAAVASLTATLASLAGYSAAPQAVQLGCLTTKVAVTAIKWVQRKASKGWSRGFKAFCDLTTLMRITTKMSKLLGILPKSLGSYVSFFLCGSSLVVQPPAIAWTAVEAKDKKGRKRIELGGKAVKQSLALATSILALAGLKSHCFPVKLSKKVLGAGLVGVRRLA